MRIEPGVIRSYTGSVHQVTVQLERSLSTYLSGVAVLSSIPPAEVRVGRKCTVVFYDENNPRDAVVVGVCGDVPPDVYGVAGWPLMQVVITPFNFLVGTGATMTTANDAIWVPFTVAKRVTISRVRIGEIITSSGNIDVGVYTDTGVRLVSSGSIACPVAGPERDIVLNSTTFGPGTFFFGLACDNTVATFRRYFDRGLAGVYRGVNQFPLPAQWTVNGGVPGDKWFGLGCF